MKHYYAKKDGTCYKFTSSMARHAAVLLGATALTAAEAMKEFGYTDDASRRVIRCKECTAEDERRIVDEAFNKSLEG